MEILTLLANWAQIIGLPVAIIAIAISVWFYRKGRQKRALSCTFDSVVSPVEIKAGEALKGDIEIRYKGKAVENLFVVRARLKNSGNSAILKSDVVDPIKLTFPEGAELIRHPIIVSRTPHELNVDWQFGVTGNPPRVNSTSLIFDLLNPKDELSIEFICTGARGVPIITARIEGVSQVDVIGPDELRLLQRTAFVSSGCGITFMALMLGIIFFFLAMTIDALRSGKYLDAFPGVLLILFVTAISWTTFISPAIELRQVRRQKHKG